MQDQQRARSHIDAHRANPARWRGRLDDLLVDPKKVRKVVHHAAMPHADVPAFMAELRSTGGPAAKALALVILARLGEARSWA